MSANLIPASSAADRRAGQALRLASLAPRFESERHQLYYDLLVRALDAPNTHNVAVTGAYGTGKSSVLSRLREDRPGKVIELRLSTIAPEVHDVGSPPEGGASPAESRMDQIQKEIVKQLLYRLPTSKVPRSRFRRASTPNRRNEWAVAAIAGLAIMGAAFSLGLLQAFVEGLFTERWRQILGYLLLTGLTVGAAWVVTSLLRDRPAVAASVTTGPASVTLSKASETYFDKYLDEIVYFFEASSCDIVVLEDIDRFDDVQVFDTLRALNGLLNSSQQIGRRIVFVYAIRDSVFEQVGTSSPNPGAAVPVDSAKATLERASRTKFFDVIIPVVPFVSADNARDVMSDVMASSDFTISPALIRLAARHVADMRMIHNIRNEFEVYRDRLVVPPGRVPGITDDLVFAIVLYKNTHLSDFERIRYKESTLDKLYAEWRELVRVNLAAQSKQLTDLRRTRQAKQLATARAARLGKRFLEVADLFSASAPQGASVAFTGAVTSDNAMDVDAWKRVADGEEVTLVVLGPQTYSGRARTPLSLTREHLEKLLGFSLSPSDWDLEASATDEQIAGVESQIEFLRHHTWETLCEHHEFTLGDAAAQNGDRGTAPGKNFGELVDDVLKSDLARELVKHGFLTSHFALYTAVYYGNHLSRDAMQYIRFAIEPGVPDATFTLGPGDVAQILREQGADRRDDADLFSDPSVYNVSILDHLLSKRPGAARTVARNLARMGELEREFVDTYMVQGAAPGALLKQLAPNWRGAVEYAATQAPVDDSARLALLDDVLWAITSTAYAAGPDVRTVFEAGYRELRSVTSPGDITRAGVVLGVVQASGAILESLELLDSAALEVAIELRLYPISEVNLGTCTSNDTIDLDALLEADERVYRYAVESLADYLRAVEASEPTMYSVIDGALFLELLNEIAEDTPDDLLRRFITSCGPECLVRNLAEVPQAAWPALASESGRTEATFDNVKLYIDAFGVDEHLAALLSGFDAIPGWEGADPEARRDAAVAILAASRQVADVESRVSLAASLEPGEIPVAALTPERGRFVALLLERGVIADDAAAFSRDLMVDWETFENAIAASEEFGTFVSPEILAAGQIPALLGSRKVPHAAKKAVVDGLEQYLDGASRGQVEAIASALNAHGWMVRQARISALQAAGASNGELIKLIAREDPELAILDLRALLRSMGGEYSRVAEGGRGGPTFAYDEAHGAVLRQLVGVTVGQVDVSNFKTRGRRWRATLITPRS